MLLVTIPFSHYNERARWALQHHGVVAHEQRYLPFFHTRGVRSVTRGEPRQADATGSADATPVMVLTDGRVLTSSSEIVRWADETHGTPDTTLYPPAYADEIRALEQHVHDHVGVDTRFLAYWFMAANRAAFSALARNNVNLWQRSIFAAVAPLARAGMVKQMKLTAERYEQTRARLGEELETLSTRLGGNRYLVGGRFTAADLTCAALLSPIMGPLPHYGAFVPELPGEYAALSAEARRTKIGHHVTRMFEQHRPRDPQWTRS